MSTFNRALSVLMLVCSTLLAKADHDAIKAALDAAISKHTNAVTTAKSVLLKAFDERLKEAVALGDIDAAQEIVAAKDDFQNKGAVTGSSKLKDDISRYVEARRASASELHKAYRSASLKYVASGEARKAAEVDSESGAFVAAEQKAITVGAVAAVAAAGQVKPLVTQKAKGTKEFFAEFYEEYKKAMARVEEQPTTAKKEQTHRDLTKRLDDKLEKQTWEFHCKIVDVKGSRGDDFVLHIEPPAEAPGFDEVWDCRSEVRPVRFSRQQGLALTPGDTLVIRGTPRLGVDRFDENSSFYGRSARVGDGDCRHGLLMTSVKFSIEKKKPE